MRFLKIVFLLIVFSSFSSYAALTDELLAFYPLDSTYHLNSTVGNSQTMTEEPYGVTQMPDYVEFTRGQDSSINTPGNSTLYSAPGFTHNWTISQWFFSSDLNNNGYQNLWHQMGGDINSNYGAVIYNAQADQICISYQGGFIYPIVCTQSVTGEGTWHHLVTKYEEYNSTHYTWTVYLDNQKNSTLSTYKSNRRTYLNFGDWIANGANVLEGGIRDVGIWDRVLTDVEVAQLYANNGSLTSTPSSPATVSSIFPYQNKLSILLSIVLLLSFFVL